MVHWIAMDDVGALVRLAFDRPGAFGRGPVPLGADELSFAEAAAMIGETLGEEVRYEQIALGEVRDRHARGMYRWFQNHARYEPDVDELRRLHPGLLTFRQWLEAGRLDLGKIEQSGRRLRSRRDGGPPGTGQPVSSARTSRLARTTSRCSARVQPTSKSDALGRRVDGVDVGDHHGRRFETLEAVDRRVLGRARAQVDGVEVAGDAGGHPVAELLLLLLPPPAP